MEVDLEQVKKLLEAKKRMTAEDVATTLGFVLTQENRRKVLQKVRAALRKVVDSNGGKREEIDNEGRQIYELS
jgi:hypothetical protein